MKLNLRKKNKGFTLVEILLVVGFIALASIGIYAVYNKVQSQSKANGMSTDIQTLRAGIKNLYGGNTNYGTLTNTVIENARIAPSTILTGTAGTFQNAFGGTLVVTPTTLAGGAANNGFAITVNQLPGDVCTKLLAAVGPSFEQVGVAAGGATIKNAATANQVIDGAAIATACTGDNRVLSFQSF